MSEKKLWILRESRKGPIIPGYMFSDKIAAKKARDMFFNGNAVVSIGPDHKRWRGHASQAFVTVSAITCEE